MNTKYDTIRFPEAQYGELAASTVLADRYTFSVETCSATEGATIHSRTFDHAGSPHTLDGTVYPTVEDARRAGFEAGLIGYHVKVR